jgi:hypothetical protein
MTATMHAERFRVYEPAECGPDHYPLAWHGRDGGPAVKDLARAQAGHRCIRCGHPYVAGTGSLSPCDDGCRHGGEVRCSLDGPLQLSVEAWAEHRAGCAAEHVAVWRILTVHHLRTGQDAKRDLRWWNLAVLCQRCHLAVQRRVVMDRVWPWEHTAWMRPHAAAWYAWSYLGEDLSREAVAERLEDLLALERMA